jgi:hypothetical protein
MSEKEPGWFEIAQRRVTALLAWTREIATKRIALIANGADTSDKWFAPRYAKHLFQLLSGNLRGTYAVQVNLNAGFGRSRGYVRAIPCPKRDVPSKHFACHEERCDLLFLDVRNRRGHPRG